MTIIDGHVPNYEYARLQAENERLRDAMKRAAVKLDKDPDPRSREIATALLAAIRETTV